MKKFCGLILYTLFVSFHIFAQSSQSAEITVAAAANLLPVMDSLTADFSRRHPVKLEVTFGASGQLATQIRNGAPYHVFLSADTAFVNALVVDGFARDSLTLYARGQLVFCTQPAQLPDAALQLLSEKPELRLAISNPVLAPYGAQSLQALKKAGIDPATRTNLIFARNIGQVNHFLVSQTVDAGITALSAVYSKHWPKNLRCTAVASTLYEPILQGAIITRHAQGNSLKASRLLLKYLRSTAAREILRQFGYREP